jgi:branched-chain amino acid aminotransferase
MNDITGLYYSEENVFRKTAHMSTVDFQQGMVLYEVLRIHNGTALFLEDHIQRLQHSINLSGLSYTVLPAQIYRLLGELCAHNAVQNGNVKIIVHFVKGQLPVLFTFFIRHIYPSPEMYLEGVETDIFRAERSDPNVKRVHRDLLLHSSAFIATKNIYDALLVDEQEQVTEGSKTNVFFVSANTVYTAPADRVLKGITRGKVIQLCTVLHIPFMECAIPIASLPDYDAAFFSGTSPKILPIRRLANLHIPVSNSVMRSLMEAYDKLMSAYTYSG